MGSIIMEPEDMEVFGGDGGSRPFWNFTTVCVSVKRIHSSGVFFGSNPLSYAFPLLLMQLSLSSVVVLLISALLRPLGQPVMVSQLLGGILMGPSFMDTKFTRMMFPMKGLVVLDTVSSFGYMFYFFLVGVQIDPWMLKRIDRRTFAIGIFRVAIPLVLGLLWSFPIQYINFDTDATSSLPMVAQVESFFAFPAIACYLGELKIINSELGRMALTSSMVSGFFSFLLATISMTANQPTNEKTKLLFRTTLIAIIFAAIIFCVLRPTLVWIIAQSLQGEPLREDQLYLVLMCVLLAGFFSHAVGLDILYGPLVLGIAIPTGPPLGSALLEKLDLMVSWIFMPLFFVKTGLLMNIFAIEVKNYLIAQTVVLICCIGKFIGGFLPSFFTNMPLSDAISIGLVMNAQSILELGMFRLMKISKAIDNEAFVAMSTSVVIVTGVMTPIIKRLYDSTRRYVVYNTRNIINSSPNSELQILVCLHDQESVAAMINFLEACNPTKRNPIAIYVLHLIELIGRASPLLIPYRQSTQPGSMSRASEHIVDAFKYYEQINHGLVSVHPFTAVSPYRTMHDDVCTVAGGKKTSLIIIPYHKRFGANGSLQSLNNGIKITNARVLDTAPCSVCVLIDRGLSNNSRSSLPSWSSYRVGVVFLGGADDREALALGARMAGLPNINLTMIRLLENGSITTSDTGERKLDNEVISEFRLSMLGNNHVMYMEEAIMDASGTLAVIQSMEDNYELLIVGRRHNDASPIIQGLADRKEYLELGVIGEYLASPDFKGKTTVLVVQQHTNVGDRNCRKQAGYSDLYRSCRMEGEEGEPLPTIDLFINQSRRTISV